MLPVDAHPFRLTDMTKNGSCTVSKRVCGLGVKNEWRLAKQQNDNRLVGEKGKIRTTTGCQCQRGTDANTNYNSMKRRRRKDCSLTFAAVVFGKRTAARMQSGSLHLPQTVTETEDEVVNTDRNDDVTAPRNDLGYAMQRNLN